MANGEEEREQRHTLPKRVSLEEDSCHANCTMAGMTPFDVAILFGRVRPVSAAKRQTSLVKLYDRQTRVLWEALGGSLGSEREGSQPNTEGSSGEPSTSRLYAF